MYFYSFFECKFSSLVLLTQFSNGANKIAFPSMPAIAFHTLVDFCLKSKTCNAYFTIIYGHNLNASNCLNFINFKFLFPAFIRIVFLLFITEVVFYDITSASVRISCLFSWSFLVYWRFSLWCFFDCCLV